jgi:hypothetical protein
MATLVLEGTWEEIKRQSKKLVGRKVRVTVLDEEILPRPNQKALDVIRKVSERQKTMRETSGENTLDMIRQARSGAMFNYDSNE